MTFFSEFTNPPELKEKAPEAKKGYRGFLSKSLAVASTHRRLPRPTEGRWGIHNGPDGFYGVVGYSQCDLSGSEEVLNKARRDFTVNLVEVLRGSLLSLYGRTNPMDDLSIAKKC